MLSKTQLANGVFALLGIDSVINIEDAQGDDAVAFRNLLDICRRKVLRESSWRFAMRTKKLSQLDSAETGIDFTNAYQLPTNPACIQVIRTNLGIDDAWARYGNELHANCQPTIEYVADVGVDEFDSSAGQCLMLLLASELAVSLKGSRTLGADYYGQYRMCLTEARQSNEHERGRKDRHGKSLRQARRYAGGDFTGGR